MAGQPLAIKLRCTSWGQVAAIHDRDLKRGKLFLKTAAAIALGREVRVDLMLPSGTLAALEGRVAHIVPPGERGPGIELVLTKVPPSTLYLIESALRAASAAPVEETEPTEESHTSEAERDLESALEEELRGLRQMNPFQVLGLPVDTSDEAVRRAFIDLSKKYHPDLFARFESERGRQLASDIFVTIRDAYRKIADTPGRNLARNQLEKGLRRDLTPIFGVPVAGGGGGGGATPVMGVPVPGERPASRRAPTPVRGVPIPPSHSPSQPPPSPSQPPQSPFARTVPRREGTPIQGVPVPRSPSRDPAAPDPIGPESSAPTIAVPPAPQRRGPPPPPHTRVAPAVPPPPPLPSQALSPLVTFKGGSEEPASAAGLNLDDLFRDVGDMPRSTHAMSPINLDEPAETKAASDLIELGRFEEALASYEEQLRRNPTDRSARAGKELAFGLKLAAAGDRQGAIQHLEAALEIEPWSERTARALNGARRAQTDSRKGLLSKLLGRGT